MLQLSCRAFEHRSRSNGGSCAVCAAFNLLLQLLLAWRIRGLSMPPPALALLS